MKKLIVSLLCVLMILLNGCSPSAPSDPDEGKTDYSEDWRNRPIPESFDLRSVDTDGDGQGDRCFVTPIRLQNPFGTCWGFAAIAAAEISILGHNMKEDKDAWKTLNLSEKQLAYFTNVPINDPNNPQNGEGRHPSDINDSTDVYGRGGTMALATSTFAQGVGPSYEYDERYDDYFTYRGRNHYADFRFIDGDYRTFSYAAEDDWTIPEEYRFKRDFILTYTHMLPSPAGRNLLGNYVYNLTATQLIKEELLDKKGVLIGFCADTSQPSQEVTEGIYIELENWAHYTWSPTATANHAVTIIGWDDNYPKENFISEHMPPENGAWLVKNSWGSGEEEFPASGTRHWGIKVPDTDEKGNPILDENGDPVMVGSGYFWLSYYDMSLRQPETFTFDTTYQDEHIYQYDCMPASEFTYMTNNDPVSMANVFTSDHAETLEAISCIVAMDMTSVEYKVYLLPDNYADPEQGQLVSSGTEVFEFSGFHRIPLSDSIDLQAGQKYSVVMTLSVDGDTYYLNTPTGMIAKGLMDQRAVVNPGESFVKDNDNWVDYKDVIDNEFAEEDDPYALISVTKSYDNFPIKAYTVPKAGNMNIILNSSKSKLSLLDGADTTTVTCTFRGLDEIKIGNPEITWQLAPGSEEIVEMNKAPEGRSVTIKAKKYGRALVTAAVEGIGTAVMAIDVMAVIPTTFLPSATAKVYTGEPQTVSVLVLSNAGTAMLEGIDITLKFSNNVNCGIATVEICDLEGNSFDPAAKAYYAIIPQKAEITSVGNSYDSIEVTVADQWASGISGYELEYRAAGSENWKTVRVTEGNVLTATGLARGSYDVRVRAFVDTSKMEKELYNNDIYYGDYSEEVSVSF